MNNPQKPRRTRSQIVEASRRRRIARWREMCDKVENPLAADAHPESAQLYREVIEAMGGEAQVSPQQRMLIQRIVVTKRRLDQIHTAIERNGGPEFLPAEASYTWLLLSLLRTLGLFRIDRTFQSFKDFVDGMRQRA
jgi:hypothetical protein